MVTRAPAWTTDDDVELRRLAERGYTVTRLCIVMKRPVAYLKIRAKLLDIILRKPQRLPSNERTYLGIGKNMGRMRRSD
jgi:hypothetical protein